MDRRRNAYFLSDLHLGARYFRSAHEAEKRAVAFLDHIKDDAAEIYLLGDVLDYWYEYRYVVPKGFVRFFGKLAELADNGVKITWLIGNHDIWIFDYLPSEIGLKVHDGILVTELDGHRFLLEHGDGVGRLPWSFRRLRSLFRSRTAQRLFAAIHPRWTVGFAHSWSSHSRKQGGYVASDRAGDSLIEFAEEYSRNPSNPKVDYFIFGHCHILLRKPVGNGAEMVILGDWISRFSYAVWDGNSLSTRIYEE